METILVARAPVRINLGGGGAGLESYYERYGGLVVSAAIGYYVYTILTPSQREGVQVIYAGQQFFSHDPDWQDISRDNTLGLPKAITHHFSIQDGWTIFIAPQVPIDTGLGLAGSIAVSMIKALAFCCGLDLAPKEVAELANYIEIEKLGIPIGKQDQYMAALGGLNSITFSKNNMIVEPLHMPRNAREDIEKRLMLFLIKGCDPVPSAPLYQRKATRQKGGKAVHRLTTLNKLTVDIRIALEQGDLDTFGELLHHSWLEKESLTEGTTDSFLNQCYQLARENGALGGKTSSNGSSSFLILYCPEDRQTAVTDVLGTLGLERWTLTLEDQGVHVMQAIPWSRPTMMPSMPWSQMPMPQHTASVIDEIG